MPPERSWGSSLGTGRSCETICQVAADVATIDAPISTQPEAALVRHPQTKTRSLFCAFFFCGVAYLRHPVFVFVFYQDRRPQIKGFRGEAIVFIGVADEIHARICRRCTSDKRY